MSLQEQVMLCETLQACREDRVALATPDGVTTWRTLHAEIEQRIESLERLKSQRLAVRLPASSAAVATLAALDALGCHLFLLDEQTSHDQAMQRARDLQLDGLIGWDQGVWFDEPTEGPHQPPVRGGVTLLTSGTEGPAKAVEHTWMTLARPTRRTAEGAGQVWALCYRVHLYAGLQVLLQALLNHGQLVMPDLSAEPDRVIGQFIDHGVRYVSATPSFVRRLLLLADPGQFKQVPLRQITMGGEVVDQAVIDGIRRLFPDARIVHIYATSELGRCFSVADGQEGFPTDYLREGAIPGVDLKVVDNELHVRSQNSMVDYDPLGHAGAGLDEEGWRATGDLVDVRGERILFAGRRGDLINVGGNKVRPIEVERVIREVDGVSDVRVFGQSSSLAGQLVACDIVLTTGAEEATVRQGVIDACALRLSRYEIPRMINVVTSIATTAAGKTPRQRS
ncbi:MAG: class I adenylate-forming enzyme family protein [Planctomycetota bacterium]